MAKQKWIITHQDGTEVPFDGNGYDAMKKGLEVGKHFMAEPIEDYDARKEREKGKKVKETVK